jgi:hypothetical protein
VAAKAAAIPLEARLCGRRAAGKDSESFGSSCRTVKREKAFAVRLGKPPEEWRSPSEPLGSLADLPFETRQASLLVMTP